MQYLTRDVTTYTEQELRAHFATYSREGLIYWLENNDHNGTYNDEACISEDMEPLTSGDAIDLIISQINAEK